jgi:hypothetical protein
VTNPIVIRANESIGQISAEADDDFLFECFVDHPALAEFSDTRSPKMLLLGGTGSGKTALIRMINKNQERCHLIQLEELSLTYISNSDVLQYLAALDVPLAQFFQALWKHVICLEYMKLRYAVSDESKSRRIWGNIAEVFQRDRTKQKALQYLERWENRFWISFEENIREITENLEAEVRADFGAEIRKFNADAGYLRKLGNEKKRQFQRRLSIIINSDLLADLGQVISLLGNLDRDRKVVNHILIDRLDEEWISSDVRYKLIRSLIEALKSLRKISDLKVIVALRADLLEKVIVSTRNEGFQGEKYEDYIYRLKWSSDELRKVVDRRLNYLFRRKYTKENIHIGDIFPASIGKEKTFPYSIQRTFMRPRDIIGFTNKCLAEATGKSSINQTDVRQAERIHSEERLQALIDEWRLVFPAIEPVLNMLRNRRAFFTVEELSSAPSIDLLLDELLSDDVYHSDSLFGHVERITESSSGEKINAVVVDVVERLHLVGAIGVNPGPEHPIDWFYKINRRVSRGVIQADSRVRIHPMLHKALGVKL